MLEERHGSFSAAFNEYAEGSSRNIPLNCVKLYDSSNGHNLIAEYAEGQLLAMPQPQLYKSFLAKAGRDTANAEARAAAIGMYAR